MVDEKFAFRAKCLVMRLAIFLDEPNHTATALADQCDCAVSTITRIASGKLTPSLRLAERIVKETDGRVGFADLIGTA